MSNSTLRLARSNVLRHPLGTELKTPLLAPSFSSKGFEYAENNISEISGIFEVSAKELITDTMLVSAYDIHYKHIPDIQHSIAEITFLDSGGYEVSTSHDMSTVYHSSISHHEWSPSLLGGVLDRWPAHVPAVFVSYDDGLTHKSINEQVSNARQLLAHYPNQLHCILLKPETQAQKYLQIDNIIGHISDLSVFNVVGVTEKELGWTMLERMRRISDIRLALDDRHITAPIHVFGSLDPISSVLYFLAGAEIFDGLTWIRYGYHDGLATYPHNYGPITVGIKKNQTQLRAEMLSRNLNYLSELESEMRIFALDGDFSKFTNHAEFFRISYDKLRTSQARIQ